MAIKITMSMYSTAHVGLPLGNIGSADEFQCLRLSTSNRIALKRSYAGQEFIRILLSLVPMQALLSFPLLA